MDAERREELKHNALGDFLIKAKETVDRWATPVLIAVALVVVGIVGYRLWRWQKDLELERGWATLSSLNRSLGQERLSDPDALRALADKGIDQRLSAAARLRVAVVLRDKFMETGDAALLDQIDAELRAVADAPDVPDQIKASALYQQALVLETRRDFEGAKAAYQRLADGTRFAGSPYKDLAAQKISELPELATPVPFVPGIPPPPASASAPAESPDAEDDARAPASAPASAPTDRTPPAAPTAPASQPASAASP